MDKVLESMIANMPEKTGKSLEEWKIILAEKNFEKHSEGVKYLKSLGVTHGFANTIVALSKNESNSNEDLVENQYAGKESLIPIYETLTKFMIGLGNDVKLVPKKGSVSIVRNKQFALIKPATKSRIDLGLKLRNRKSSGRLGDSGPFGTMCTHRVQISELTEVDSELKTWIQEAYEESL